MIFQSDRRTHVRCRKCEARRVLPRHPNRYTGRLPYCRIPGCGSRDYRVDKWMNNRCNGLAGYGCNCGGYAGVFRHSASIHRKGSTYCWKRADGTDRFPGDIDFRSHYSEQASNDDTAHIQIRHA